MTSAEILTRATERLDEDASTSQRYTTADLTEYLNDGARFYVAKTGCQYATTIIDIVAQQLLYQLPCDFIQVERVVWVNGSTYVGLEPTQPRTLDENHWKWQRQTGPRATNYFIFAPRKIGLWPLATETGARYIVHYQQDVAEDITAVPSEDHHALVDYVMARALLSEGNARDGAARYGKYADVVKAATRRRSNGDRVWGIQRG